MKHWTEDDFLRWLYADTGPAASLEIAHLQECRECRQRADRMTETRRQAIAPPEISWEFLAAQRRSIYTKLDDQTGTRSVARRWAVALASLVCVVGLSVTMLHPWTTTNALYTSSDEQLFSDLAAIEQSSEARTIRPIHNLFEE